METSLNKLDFWDELDGLHGNEAVCRQVSEEVGNVHV